MITGASGFLGCDLCKEFSAEGDVTGLARGQRNVKQCRASEMLAADITDRDRLIQIVRKLKPGIVINSAAITDVDFCELNPEEAFRINAEGAKNAADAVPRASPHTLMNDLPFHLSCGQSSTASPPMPSASAP